MHHNTKLGPLVTVEAYAGYCKALMDLRELLGRHDLKLGRKAREHVLAALDCITTDPDRLMSAGGFLDLWWREEGKKIVYSFHESRENGGEETP